MLLTADSCSTNTAQKSSDNLSFYPSIITIQTLSIGRDGAQVSTVTTKSPLSCAISIWYF